LSQRYVDESHTDFVEPDIIARDPELHALWTRSIEQCAEAYHQLVAGLSARLEGMNDATLRRKIARQAARSVLPNATETKIFVTANARALRHFIELRCSEHAEVEIRKLAAAVCRLMQREAPNLFGDYRFVDLPDGTQVVRSDYRKV
jgi:thymidylate synthase (FAD)